MGRRLRGNAEGFHVLASGAEGSLVRAADEPGAAGHRSSHGVPRSRPGCRRRPEDRPPAHGPAPARLSPRVRHLRVQLRQPRPARAAVSTARRTAPAQRRSWARGPEDADAADSAQCATAGGWKAGCRGTGCREHRRGQGAVAALEHAHCAGDPRCIPSRGYPGLAARRRVRAPSRDPPSAPSGTEWPPPCTVRI